MYRRALVAGSGALLVAALAAGPFAQGRAAADDTRQLFTIRDPRVVESSGLAVSRLHPGVAQRRGDLGVHRDHVREAIA